MLQEGDRIPDFVLLDDQGKSVSPADFGGSWTVLYFYPKDDTPGCTTEACSFRDSLPRFQEIEAGVYGISSDSPESHRKFKEKYALPFTLLSDPDHVMQEAFGVWQEKKLYGRMYIGTVRSTFIVGPDLVIRKVFAKVRPEAHAEEVREELRNLMS